MILYFGLASSLISTLPPFSTSTLPESSTIGSSIVILGPFAFFLFTLSPSALSAPFTSTTSFLFVTADQCKSIK